MKKSDDKIKIILGLNGPVCVRVGRNACLYVCTMCVYVTVYSVIPVIYLKFSLFSFFLFFLSHMENV